MFKTFRDANSDEKNEKGLRKEMLKILITKVVSIICGDLQKKLSDEIKMGIVLTSLKKMVFKRCGNLQTSKGLFLKIFFIFESRFNKFNE